MRSISTTVLMLALCPILQAQIQDSWVVPAAFAKQNAARSNSFPWTYTNYVRHMQAIDVRAMGKPRLIDGMSFRPRAWPTQNQKSFSKIFSIRLSDSANAVNQLNGTFANNIKGKQIEVFNGPIFFPTPTGKRPAEFSVTIPFKKSYLYLGTAPLLIDIVPLDPCPPVMGGDGRGCDYDSTSTNVGSLLAKNKAGCGQPTSGAFMQSGGFVIKFWGRTLMGYGLGCKGSNGKTPLVSSSGGTPSMGNSSFQVDLTDAKASSGAVLFAGFSRSKLFGSVNLPLALAGLGATGCQLWTDIVLTAAAATDNSGRAKMPFPLPRIAALKDLPLYNQWFVVDSRANGAGFVLSSGGLFVIR